jgi:Ni,Fe-hydrogenase III large subunit
LVRQFVVAPENWARLAGDAARASWRWSGIWAEDRSPVLELSLLLERAGQYSWVRTRIPLDALRLPSQTSAYPAADRMERRIHDLFGLVFSDHPDPRRWIRHQGWSGEDFPLRRMYPTAGRPERSTPPDADYPFVLAQGSGVCEIPVGPIHAGIIEPGHFRFQVVGETILRLEERLGYAHKGIEKIAEGRDPQGLVRLAGRVSGDSTVSHAWAACQAMEQAAGLPVPGRAQVLRALFAERERIANHLGDIGAICGDVGFAFGQSQFGRLREVFLRLNDELFGHRLLMDVITPGGVRCDLPADGASRLLEERARLRHELATLRPALADNTSLQDRWCGTGILPGEVARTLGVLGYVARASGVDHDLRRDAPYVPYDLLEIRVPVADAGDVAARVRIRQDEIDISLGLMADLLDILPDGPCQSAWLAPQPGAEGLGFVESWRGELWAYVRFGTDGLIARYHPRDPSVLNWSALEHLITGAIVPDFPVCNKSVNGSYAGHDL